MWVFTWFHNQNNLELGQNKQNWKLAAKQLYICGQIKKDLSLMLQLKSSCPDSEWQNKTGLQKYVYYSQHLPRKSKSCKNEASKAQACFRARDYKIRA